MSSSQTEHIAVLHDSSFQVYEGPLQRCTHASKWLCALLGSPGCQLVYVICVTVSLYVSVDFTLQMNVELLVGSTRWPAVQKLISAPSLNLWQPLNVVSENTPHSLVTDEPSTVYIIFNFIIVVPIDKSYDVDTICNTCAI